MGVTLGSLTLDWVEVALSTNVAWCSFLRNGLCVQYQLHCRKENVKKSQNREEKSDGGFLVSGKQ